MGNAHQLDETCQRLLDLLLEADGRDDPHAVLRDILTREALETGKQKAVIEQHLLEGLDSGEPITLDAAYLDELESRMRERLHHR